MAILKLLITVTVPLPKRASAAAQLAMEVANQAAAMEREFTGLGEGIQASVATSIADEEAPAAPKVKRTRKPRAALGSSPLAEATVPARAPVVTGLGHKSDDDDPGEIPDFLKAGTGVRP